MANVLVPFCLILLSFFSTTVFSGIISRGIKSQRDLSDHEQQLPPTGSKSRRQMGMGMDMSMGLGMNMGMNMGMGLSSAPLSSMSNPLTLQMPFAPNPFYYQANPQRRHQLSLDGNGQDFLDQPLNPYESVLNSKYPTSPFERLFGKNGPLSAPPSTSSLSYQSSANSDEQGGGYSGSYSGSYESGGFGFQFGRRSTSRKTKVRLAAVRSDVFYRNEAIWNEE